MDFGYFLLGLMFGAGRHRPMTLAEVAADAAVTRRVCGILAAIMPPMLVCSGIAYLVQSDFRYIFAIPTGLVGYAVSEDVKSTAALLAPVSMIWAVFRHMVR